MPSITKSNEINNNRSASDNFEYKGTAVRAWRVETDDNSIDAVQILDNAHLASPDPIALIGAQHPSSGILYCKSRDCKPDGDDGRAWIVTANYDNQLSEDPEERNSNPLLRPVKYGLEWSQFTTILTKDVNGDPILNTVGDEFDEPLEDDDDSPILVAVRNEDAANLASLIALAVDYRNATNSDTFYGAPAGCVKMAPIELGDIQYENGQAYYSVRYAFMFKDEQEGGVPGWDRQILNRGNNFYKTANTPSTKTSIGAEGPVNLKEDGTKAGPSDDPYYIPVQTKKRRSFGALGL